MMNTKRRFISLIIFFAAGSIIPLTVFSEPDVYHLDSNRISNLRNSAKKEQIHKSKDFLHKALYYHKKKKDWRKSIHYYEQSLVIYPTATAYYELGNAHMNLGSFPKAIQSFELAIYLNSQDTTYRAYYNIACCYSLQKEVNRSLEYLEKAFRYGYYSFHYAAIDSDLAYARKSAMFHALIKKYNNTSNLTQLLIGIWYNAPVIAERSPATYVFYANGKFSFQYDANQAVDRRVSMSGTWKVSGNRLYLLVTKRQDKKGGTIVNSDIHPGEKTISGYTLVTRILNPATKVTKSVSHIVFDDKYNLGKDRANVMIKDERFWKVP